MIGSPRQPGLSCVPASFPNLHNAIDLSVLDGECGGDGHRLRLLAAATPYAPSNGGRRRSQLWRLRSVQARHEACRVLLFDSPHGA